MAKQDVGAITRHRVTNVRFDPSETVLVETANIWRREGKVIFPESTTDVEQLKSGCWILRPENDISILHEREDAHQYILRLSDATASAVCVEVPGQRKQTELSGTSPSADVATTGDWYITKRVQAGESWNQPLTPAEAGPTLTDEHFPLDPVMMWSNTALFDANTGFIVKVVLPGSRLANPDYLFGFRFGGELIGSGMITPPESYGFGRFEVILDGAGNLLLFERVNGAWKRHRAWKFLSFDQIAGSAFIMRILPHPPRYLEIRAYAAASSEPIGQEVADYAVAGDIIAAGENVRRRELLHIIDNRGRHAAFGNTVFLRPITGPGNVVVSVRRDLRPAWQVARIAYREEGTITDRAFRVPYGVANQHILRIRVQGYNHIAPDTETVTELSGIVQGASGGALTPANENVSLNGQSYAFSGFTPPGGTGKCRAVLTLTNLEDAGQRWHTPVVEGYHVIRNPHTVVNSTTEVTAEPKGVSIQGVGFHPDREGATLQIEDTKNLLGTVQTRRTPVIVETTYDSADQTKKCILFRGYTARVTSTQRGKTGKTYPSPDWKSMRCELVGMWDRLNANRFWHQQINLSDASTSLRGVSGTARVPWKVTDFIREVIWMCGFPDAQINIPDIPITFFAAKSSDAQDSYLIPPGTRLSDLLPAVSRDHLNCYLVFDANAGSDGQWRLLAPPNATSPALWTFTLEACAAGKAPHLSASYGSNISPILEIDGAEYRSYPQYPEANVITVTSRPMAGASSVDTFVQQEMNFKSFRAPGFTSQADPTSVDWLGMIQEVAYTDPTLETQEAVNWVTRRIANAVLYGRRIHSFAAEAVLIDAATAEPSVYTTNTHRPLRAGDVVNLKSRTGATTRCVVQSMNVSYEKTVHQVAFYELEEFRSGMVVGS